MGIPAARPSVATNVREADILVSRGGPDEASVLWPGSHSQHFAREVPGSAFSDPGSEKSTWVCPAAHALLGVESQSHPTVMAQCHPVQGDKVIFGNRGVLRRGVMRT